MLNPLVSILMNCHNGEKYLIQAVSSVLAQTYENFELVFFDNASTDKTEYIIKSFNDKRIKYFKSLKKLTLSEARLEAWKHINGEYVAILDTDDICFPNRLSNQLKCFLSDTELSVLGGNCEIINDKGYIIGKTNHIKSSKELKKKISYSFPFNNATLMFKKEHVDNVGGYPKKYTMINDYVLVYNLACKYKISNTLDFISQNRQHKENLSNKKYIIGLIEHYEFLNHISKDISNKKIIKKNLIYISRYYFKILIYYILNFKFNELLLHLKRFQFLNIIYLLFNAK
tara:strand:- start:1822 stop:2679 length:858 start_codon:yes stop_codon:yes gene_type:complete